MIGIDILENERMKEKLVNPEFIKTFLTDNEQKYVSSFGDITERVTGIFCVKEAVKKAFGCPDKMGYKAMEIRHFENGKPYVVFDKSLLDIIKNTFVEISVSHSKTVTVGVCLAFGADDSEEDECHCHEDECDCEDDCDCECDCGDDCTCGEDCDCDCGCEDCNCAEGECHCHEDGCQCEDCKCEEENKECHCQEENKECHCKEDGKECHCKKK